MQFASRVKHNGEVFEAGDEVNKKNFSKSQLARLQELGVVTDEAVEVEADDEEAEGEYPEGEPKASWLKAELLAWGQDNDLDVSDDMTRDDIWDVVKEAKN